jgi:hypothetical protein
MAFFNSLRREMNSRLALKIKHWACLIFDATHPAAPGSLFFNKLLEPVLKYNGCDKAQQKCAGQG